VSRRVSPVPAPRGAAAGRLPARGTTAALRLPEPQPEEPAEQSCSLTPGRRGCSPPAWHGRGCWCLLTFSLLFYPLSSSSCAQEGCPDRPLPSKRRRQPSPAAGRAVRSLAGRVPSAAAWNFSPESVTLPHPSLGCLSPARGPLAPAPRQVPSPGCSSLSPGQREPWAAGM